MRKFLFILVCILLFLFSSCSDEKDIPTFSVLTWNMYSFYDSVESGNENEEFKGKNYSKTKYDERVKKTSKAMCDVFNEVDLIVLQEVESEEVLKDLLSSSLQKKGYMYYFLSPGDGLRHGFISKIRPSDVKVHKIDENGTRSILELNFHLNGEDITIFSVHLRSRLSNKNTEIRINELKYLSYLISKHKNENVIVLGDFNTSPVYNDGDVSLDREKKNTPIIFTGDGATAKENVLYSPEYDRENPLKGYSYYYNGEGVFLDHILCNYLFFDGNGWEYSRSEVIKIPDSVDGAGNPIKYNPQSGIGYSDHFAILSSFRYT